MERTENLESRGVDSTCGSETPQVILGKLVNFSEPPIPLKKNKSVKDSKEMMDENMLYKSESALCPKDDTAVSGTACLPACQSSGYSQHSNWSDCFKI